MSARSLSLEGLHEGREKRERCNYFLGVSEGFKFAAAFCNS
jgi:hypothetical protein